MTHFEKTKRNLGVFMGVLRVHNMHVTYMMLLAMARSGRHLEELHDSLWPNQRLCRDDLHALKGLWQDMNVTPEERETWNHLLLGMSSFGKNNQCADLTTYYVNVLDVGRQERSRAELGIYTGESERIVTSRERGGRVSDRFVLDLCGYPFDVSCTIVADTMVIRLTMWSVDLTEELTHKLASISALQNSSIAALEVGGARGRRSSSDRGIEVDFNFIVDASLFTTVGAVSERVESTPGVISPRPDRYANGRLFLGTLAMTLRGFGLPFTNLHAIVPWDEETCIPGTQFEQGRIGDEPFVWGETDYRTAAPAVQ